MKNLLKRYLPILLVVALLAAVPSCGPKIIIPPEEPPVEEPPVEKPPVEEPPVEEPPVEEPAEPEAGWIERPEMERIDGVEYLTYYISADGMSMSESTSAGRRRNMTIAFDTERHVPRWVAHPMHTWYWTPTTTGRTDTWDWDPTLPREVQPDIVTNGSYWQQAPDGAFARGHMLASADRLRSVPMNTQTFYVSNLAPQVNDDFNGGVWADLEFAVRDWSGSLTDTLYCVTGVAFEWDKVTYDKRSPRRMEVKVPSHFYKVLLQRKDGTTKTPVSKLSASELRCIGFWFENKAQKGATIEDAAMRVSDIEKRVGLEFFPLLSDEAASVKETLDLADWDLE